MNPLVKGCDVLLPSRSFSETFISKAVKDRPISLTKELNRILDEQQLRAHFQPILDLRNGDIHGFEGLIRGPSGSSLQAPAQLFKTASSEGQLFQLERACVRTLARDYAAHARTQRLFLNISPHTLSFGSLESIASLDEIRALGLTPERIVIELTEAQPTLDFKKLRQAADLYREQGFLLAIDDLGEGYSSLRLWLDLRPDYVKIDMHFVQGVSEDLVKQQFLHSIQEIAAKAGATVVAEGLETEADLRTVLDLGLELGQGYLLGRPNAIPALMEPKSTILDHRNPSTREHIQAPWISQSRSTASKLMVYIPPIPPETTQGRVQDRFLKESDLQSIPVVKDDIPVGLINRHAFLDAMAKPFSRELHGKKPCKASMNRELLVVDHGIGLHELSELILESDPRHILHGFIITRDGRYAGMGSGHDLMREITQMQIHAARYANPLTLLPGNVPINEHLDGLLAQRMPFVVCYCDLDHFKPYNDVYGYRKGDEVIHWTGKLLETLCHPDLDFVGHIGGDDFILVLRSEDWEQRCQRLLRRFEAERSRFFNDEDLRQGGYQTEDRQRRMVFHPLLSMSIGIVPVPSGAFSTHHEISSAAALAKKEAKGMDGCSLFIERRNMGCSDWGRSLIEPT